MTPVPHVLLIPLVVTAVTPPEFTLLTVNIKSLAGLNPPNAEPKILIVSLRLYPEPAVVLVAV